MQNLEDSQDSERRASDYLIKLAAMNDDALYRECRVNNAKPMFRNEESSFDHMWKLQACYKEAKRRGKVEIYTRAKDDENGPPDLMIEFSGCANPIPFNFSTQSFSDADGLQTTITTAGSHKLAMMQGFTGDVSVWVDDSGNFRCRAARFTSRREGTTLVGGSEEIKESLHVGDKASAEAWLAFWWPKMRDIEDQP